MNNFSRANTRYTLIFELSVPPSTVANQRNPDKAKLKTTTLALRAQGWSYREIAAEVGLHRMRVGQIVKSMRTNTG
ncbi:MAG: helix-turn-helix domain-containing protein [Anaerolineales bacterium]|nr:helix-turn-helix domain-containing protein [Anaerolineales bacterium]